MSTSTLTADFAPADQLTFRPRTIDEAQAAPGEPTPVARPALYVVPVLDTVEVADQLATVHHLPVMHRDDVYRRRLVVLALIVGLVLGVVSFMRSADATPTAAGQQAEAVTVVVQPGDTLWAIAGELAPDADPRPLVARLAELTGSSSLQPGQQIVVPGAWLD